MIDSETALRVARTAALSAGKVVLEHWGVLRGQVQDKAPGDVISAADLASDKIIAESIQAEYPRHARLSEEDIDHPRFDRSGPLWIVDPIYGTANYVRGHPYFGISVAFAIDGIVMAACVHAPALGETFTAIKERGAFLNGVPIRASVPASLPRAIVSTGFPHHRPDAEPHVRRVRRLLEACQDVRRSASPVLDIAYVGAGRLDAHTETLFPWDVAAAGLVATEAGAVRGHLTFGARVLPADLDGEDVVFAAPGIYDDLVACLTGQA